MSAGMCVWGEGVFGCEYACGCVCGVVRAYGRGCGDVCVCIGVYKWVCA